MINVVKDINRFVMIYVMVIWLWKELSGVVVVLIISIMLNRIVLIIRC